MKVLIFQHTTETPVGSTRLWLEERGHSWNVVHFWRDTPPVDLGDIDALIICGGEPGVHDEARFPWLRQEKVLIESALRRRIPTVGLCLGGQLLAHVLGARVFRHRDWEIGWHSVESVGGPTAPWDTGESFPVFQYHQDVFELPHGARRLARSDWWENQAFDHPDGVLAFQFHPETELSWVRECALDADLPGTGLVQDPQTMMSRAERDQAPLQRAYFQSLDRFFGATIKRN